MERKNIKSELDFIGLKNNKLRYKCKECFVIKKRYLSLRIYV